MTTVSSVKTKDVKPMYFLLGVVLSAISGIMLLLSFPPYGIWPLIWIAFVPYIFAQHRLLPSKVSSLRGSLPYLYP